MHLRSSLRRAGTLSVVILVCAAAPVVRGGAPENGGKVVLDWNAPGTVAANRGRSP